MSLLAGDVFYCAEKGDEAFDKGKYVLAAKWYWKALWSYYEAEDPYHVKYYADEASDRYHECYSHMNLLQRLWLKLWIIFKKQRLKRRPTW